MHLITHCAAYMALVYECCFAFLAAHQITHIIGYGEIGFGDLVVLVLGMVKVINFSMLFVGIIAHLKYMLRLWLVLSFANFDWPAMGRLIRDIYLSLTAFDAQHENTPDLMNLMANHSAVVVQFPVQLTIIMVIYRFYMKVGELKRRPATEIKCKYSKPADSEAKEMLQILQNKCKRKSYINIKCNKIFNKM